MGHRSRCEIGRSPGSRNLNFTHVETDEPIPNPDVDFNSFGSPANTIDGLYCDWWTLTCISPDGTRVIRTDHSLTTEGIATQLLPELDGYADPVRWTATASVGYPYFLGKVLGSTTRLGSLTPTTMLPVTFDARMGKLMPGQTFGPELARPGISQANGLITSHGPRRIPHGFRAALRSKDRPPQARPLGLFLFRLRVIGGGDHPAVAQVANQYGIGPDLHVCSTISPLQAGPVVEPHASPRDEAEAAGGKDPLRCLTLPAHPDVIRVEGFFGPGRIAREKIPHLEKMRSNKKTRMPLEDVHGF